MGDPLRTVVCLGVALFVLMPESDAFKLKTHKHPHFIMGRPFHGLRPPPVDEEELTRAADAIQTGTITQPVDHFNSSDTRTWTQYYHFNLKWATTGSPIFLMLGGEGPEGGGWTVTEDLSYMVWAKNFSAAVFDIEHRFYGKSRPFETQTTENLRYLSSRQAIEDVAAFIREMNTQHKYENPKWIVFGGSYSGALALWVREKHPELVVGAVGSSGPVEAVLDFYDYLKVVEQSLTTHNQKCADAVREGFQVISQLLLSEEGRNNLSDTFSLVPRLNETKLRYTDLQNFYSTIYGNFQGAVQYSGDNAGAYATAGGIKNVCEIMMNETMSALDRVAAVNVYMTEFYAGNFTGTGNSYDEMIDSLKYYIYDESGDNAASRSWVWQSCTEFGYFQSTDRPTIFGSLAPNNLYINMCADVFGDSFTATQIQTNVRSTNQYYGGRYRYKGTNVVMPNGDVDPWHALGQYSTEEFSAVPYLIKGTAHCADMYAASPNDQPGLKTVRQIIYNNLQRWIKGVPIVEPARIAKDPKAEIKAPSMKHFISKVQKLPLGKFNSEDHSVPNPAFTGLPHLIMGRPRHGLLPDPEASKAADYPKEFEKGTITQPLDNFDNINPTTFQQRYWMNSQYYKPGGPLFLFIGGEGPAAEKWVTNEEVQIMRSAKKYNAAVFMLEHRFYGQSKPAMTEANYADLTKFLSSRQALADIARFIQTMNVVKSYSNPQWVTFGGSYAGLLSAWFREFYPNLTVGAIASSAPLDVKVDFFEYLIVTAQSLKTYNPECASNVQKAFDEMHQLVLTPEGRAQLSKTFTLKPEWTVDSVVTDVDVQNFFTNIYGNFQGAVQYNNDNTGKHAEGGGIKEICDIMLDTKHTILERVSLANVYMSKFYSGNFTYTDNNYKGYVDTLKKSGFGDDSAGYCWTYQTCTEFGYFQSTDIGDNIFGSPTPVNFFVNMCKDVFGIHVDSVYEKVNLVEHFLGWDQYSGTNVVFINGDVDPWHALGLYGNTATTTSMLVIGTAHCADMYPPRGSDVPMLNDARNLIDSTLAKWLSGPVTCTPGSVSPGTIITTTAPQQSTTSSASVNVVGFALLLTSFIVFY